MLLHSYAVIVPLNCTDTLQSLDVSVNKPAKDFLQQKFQEWYVSKIADQLRSGTSSKGLQPVDVKLSTVKSLAIGARWMIELHD